MTARHHEVETLLPVLEIDMAMQGEFNREIAKN